MEWISSGWPKLVKLHPRRPPRSPPLLPIGHTDPTDADTGHDLSDIVMSTPCYRSLDLNIMLDCSEWPPGLLVKNA